MKNNKLVKYFSFIFLILSITFSQQLLASPAGDNIIFSEVEYNPSGPENEAEWFELYNPTASAIDISNWFVQEGGSYYYQFPSTTVIPAGGYLLVVNDTAGFQSEHPGITPDIDMSGSGCYSNTECLRLNNSGTDSITLYFPTMLAGDDLDYIAWGGPGNQTAGNGQAVCRNTSIDTDTDVDWSSNCTPTPGTGSLTPLNSAPTDITLSSNDIDENNPDGTTVGVLSTTDPDTGDTHTYTLVAGAGDTDNTSFTIVGANLNISTSPDYEAQNSYSIRIQTDDGNGGTYQKQFTITVNDLDEIPPTATFTYSETNPTNQNVTVTMTTSEPIVLPTGWTQISPTEYTKVVTQNENVTFDIQDTSGNTTSVTYNVTNIDTQNPTITLNGSNPQTVIQGQVYTEQGATCTDNNSCTVTQTGTVDTNTQGSYTITYTAEDPAGNTTSTTRTVNVVSGSSPIITLTGPNPQTLTVGDTYTELGATANDAEDGDLTASITIDTSAVDTTTQESYNVTYTVSDSSGNTTTETRTVIVNPQPSSSKKSSRIVYVCKDKKATNYDPFGRHKSSLCKYVEQATKPTNPTTNNPFGGNQCPAHLLITDNMKKPSTDGRYSSYNKGIVTQVKTLQLHMNRLLLTDYGQQASGPVDGYFRKLTETGVKRLQMKLNTLLKGKITPLAVDGIVGPFTKKAINMSC